MIAAEAPIGPQLVKRGTEAPSEASDADTRHIVDVRLSLYSAVGRFRGTMLCTAAIALHPRIIITAGHCITERDGTIRKSNLFFQPGFQAGPVLVSSKQRCGPGSKQSFKRQSVHDASQDWAILVLDGIPKALSHFS